MTFLRARPQGDRGARTAGDEDEMTSDADFKRLVRDRMARTGETYTAARAALRPDPGSAEAARREQEQAVARLFDGPRLVRIPARRRRRTVVLLELLRRFEPGRVYQEREVNDLLRQAHEDVASLRRELVDYRYLERSDGRYRVTTTVPVRGVQEAQEVPAWEAVWLPGFIAGR